MEWWTAWDSKNQEISGISKLLIFKRADCAKSAKYAGLWHVYGTRRIGSLFLFLTISSAPKLEKERDTTKTFDVRNALEVDC